MPTLTTYSFTVSQTNLAQIALLIQQSTITTALDHCTNLDSSLSIVFKDVLSSSDVATLNSLMSSYVYAAPVNPIQPTTLTDGNGNTLNQFDVDNALIVRTKAAKKGWTYGAIAFQFKLSTPGTVKALNFDGSSKTWITLKCYDVNGVEVTDPSLFGNVVRTQVDFEPPFDYEVIGGEMRQTANLTDDVWMFIQAAPDIPASLGGSKTMAEGLNLKFLAPGNMFAVDGRVSKLLSYNSTYHSNKLRFILWHGAGLQEDLMVTVEIYRQ